MVKKLNGSAKWIVVALALATVAFNSGVTYNHVKHLTAEVNKQSIAIAELHKECEKINLILARHVSPLVQAPERK